MRAHGAWADRQRSCHFLVAGPAADFAEHVALTARQQRTPGLRDSLLAVGGSNHRFANLVVESASAGFLPEDLLCIVSAMGRSPGSIVLQRYPGVGRCQDSVLGA